MVAVASDAGTIASVSVQPFLDEALGLPQAERAEIAAALLASLGPEPESDQAAVDRAWAEELQRRADRLDSGEDVAIPLEDALADVRRGLKR